MQMNWCPYHPDPPQFLGPITEGRMAGPAGRYPCCGQQAFRYESLPGPGVTIIFYKRLPLFFTFINRVANIGSIRYNWRVIEIELFSN